MGEVEWKRWPELPHLTLHHIELTFLSTPILGRAIVCVCVCVCVCVMYVHMYEYAI